MRSSLASFSSVKLLSPGVRSAFRPVNRSVMDHPMSSGGSGSVKPLPSLVGGGDAQLLAVLRDGAPRDPQSVIAQDLHDRGVGEWPARVLLPHDLLDALLDRQRRDVLALGGADARVKEELH